MLTPQFKVEQNEEYLMICIKLKYVKISEVEFFIENNNFRFHLKPYFLNLFFSDNLKTSDNCISQYNVENGILECKLEKEVKGTVFKDIDLFSNLMENPKAKATIKQKIQVIDDGEETSTNQENKNVFKLDELNEMLHFDETAKLKDLSLVKSFKYGFNNEFSDVFTNREEELFELADINPDKIETKERFFDKFNRESSDFIPERYVFDKDETEQIEEILKLSIEGYFKMVNENSSKSSNKDDLFKDYILNEKEFKTLISLKSKKLSLLNDEIYFELYLQVIDIVYAYLYDIMTNDYEHTSESGWTINKLSSVLSNFIDFKGNFWTKQDDVFYDNFVGTCIKKVVISNFRRVICYALYRNFDLCNKILNDLTQIIAKGKVYLLKIFLDIKDTFSKCEPRYLMNLIYIDMFCIWIQKSKESIWEIIFSELKQMKITKLEVDLNLEETEKEYN